MPAAVAVKIPYLRKVLFFTHAAGLAAGALFPLVTTPVLGPAVRTLPFVLSCLAMGFALGATMFLFVRATLRRHLRLQLEQLRPLTGAVALSDDTVEGLQAAVETAIAQVDGLIGELLGTIDRLIPRYRSLADSSGYLSDRAREGLAAAQNTRVDVQAMNEKQQEVMGQVAQLSHCTQDEAALSRQLSSSLEEMAAAMEHSTAKFLETTSSVDEMASSILEVAAQADGIGRTVEGTVRDLDAFGASLEGIRTGASESAEAAEGVSRDAESGLTVVTSSLEEMERIEQESLESVAAMKRLSRQTGEVAKIIEVIKELVSDTELLAFNAAIIAAQAGEEGRGFAVVAEEIRDLADRTTTSAQDIERIVEAIGDDTRAVTNAVETTGARIRRGRELFLSTGGALRKIVASSREAANVSEEIADQTRREGERARALLAEAGRNLLSVQGIARAMNEQRLATARIQEGVGEMKGAADQIARGMEEQVRANRELDRGVAAREEQVVAIHEATRFQLATAERVFSHFAASEERLKKNAERASVIIAETGELEELAGRLRALAERFQHRGDARHMEI